MRAIMRRVFVICSCVFALRQDAFNLGEKGHSSFTEMVFCCFSHIGLTARQEPEWRADFPSLHATSPKMNGGKMADKLKFALLSLLVALVTFVAAPIAKADAWDKETIVTFSSPVEVPGQVLPLVLTCLSELTVNGIAILCRSSRKTRETFLPPPV